MLHAWLGVQETRPLPSSGAGAGTGEAGASVAPRTLHDLGAALYVHMTPEVVWALAALTMTTVIAQGMLYQVLRGATQKRENTS